MPMTGQQVGDCVDDKSERVDSLCGLCGTKLQSVRRLFIKIARTT